MWSKIGRCTNVRMTCLKLKQVLKIGAFIQTVIEYLLGMGTADGCLMVKLKRPSQSNQKDQVCKNWLNI